MDLKISKLHSDNLSSLTNLLDVCFTIKARPKKKAVKWKYFQKNFSNISYLFLDKDKAVSFYSNILVPIIKNEKEYKSGLCLDMATHPDYRGKGLITQLSQVVYQNAVKENYDFSYGFSNQFGVLVDKHSVGYGYKIVGEFELYCKLLLKKQKTNLSLIEINSFSHSGISIGKYFQIAPSRNYLSWRYLNQPAKKYMIMAVMDEKKLVGYVILNRKSTQKLEVLKIVKLDKNIETKEIFKSLQNYGLRNHYKFLFIFLLKNKFWQKQLFKAKFFKIPHRSKFYLTVKQHKKVSGILNKNNWLLMGGDII